MSILSPPRPPVSPRHPSTRGWVDDGGPGGPPRPPRPRGPARPAGRGRGPGDRPPPPRRPPERRRPDPYRRRRASGDQAVGFVVVAFLVAALLGSDSLVGLARRQELGWPRSVALTGARALDRVADGLSLDRPARAARRALGDDAPTYDVEALIAPADAPSDATAAGPGADRPTGDPANRADPAARRVPDVYEPLRIWVGGDSMARELADGLARVTPADTVLVRSDHRVSSGLTRPDFFDWPQRLAQVVIEQRPDVVVMIVGSNDDQDMETPGGVVEVGSQAWTAEYRSRVATVMDVAHQPGTTVVWVGLPPMRTAGYDRAVAAIDAVQREEAAARPWLAFVDGRSLFGGADGGYRESLPEGGGEVVVRQEDGVHWSIDGSTRVGRATWAVVAPEWGLPVG